MDPNWWIIGLDYHRSITHRFAIDSPCHSLILHGPTWPILAQWHICSWKFQCWEAWRNPPSLEARPWSWDPPPHPHWPCCTHAGYLGGSVDKARLQDVTGNLGKRAIGGAFLPHEQLNLAVFIGLDGFFSTTSSSKETQKVGRGTNSSKQKCNTPRFFQHLQLPTISAICSPYHGAKLLAQRQVHQHGAAQPLVIVFQVQHLDCHGCASSSAHWNIWNRSCKLKHSTGGHQQQNHDADTL